MEKREQELLIILDFDDTIVVSAVYFWKTYAKFLDFFFDKMIRVKNIHPERSSPTMNEVLTVLEEFETKNISLLSYSSGRMCKSFIDVFTHYKVELELWEIDGLVTLTEEPFKNKTPLMTKVIEGLQYLREFSRIIIYTRGENSIQRERIERAGIIEFIDEVYTTREKNIESIKKVMMEETQKSSNISEIWMIGNNIEADIIPALELNINCILIGHSTISSNWFRRFEIANSFLDAVKIIAGKNGSKFSENSKTLEELFK